LDRALRVTRPEFQFWNAVPVAVNSCTILKTVLAPSGAEREVSIVAIAVILSNVTRKQAVSVPDEKQIALLQVQSNWANGNADLRAAHSCL
jgi:hypothetical protein